MKCSNDTAIRNLYANWILIKPNLFHEVRLHYLILRFDLQWLDARQLTVACSLQEK